MYCKIKVRFLCLQLQNLTELPQKLQNNLEDKKQSGLLTEKLAPLSSRAFLNLSKSLCLQARCMMNSAETKTRQNIT